MLVENVKAVTSSATATDSADFLCWMDTVSTSLARTAADPVSPYAQLTFECPLETMTAEMAAWVSLVTAPNTTTATLERKSISVIFFNGAGSDSIRMAHGMNDAFISQLRMPALDAASKDAAKLMITVCCSSSAKFHDMARPIIGNIRGRQRFTWVAPMTTVFQLSTDSDADAMDAAVVQELTQIDSMQVRLAQEEGLASGKPPATPDPVATYVPSSAMSFRCRSTAANQQALVSSMKALQNSSMSISAPRDIATGQASGRRQHSDITITKSWVARDQATGQSTGRRSSITIMWDYDSLFLHSVENSGAADTRCTYAVADSQVAGQAAKKGLNAVNVRLA